MRALVIYTHERPVDVLQVPDSTALFQLHIATQRLDAMGVDYELLPVSLNGSTKELLSDVDRFLADDLEFNNSALEDREDECDECHEVWTAHANHCSGHPDNCV